MRAEPSFLPGGDSHEVAAVRQLGQALRQAPAYRELNHDARRELDRSLGRIGQMLAPLGGPGLARQMAPDLRSQLAPGEVQSPSPGPQPAVAPPAASSSQAPTAGTGPVGRVGEVARATLNAIDFPSFVASLIQGTFQAIVDASIQQMEAYAELLKNVAGTVDKFMNDNVSDGMAKDYLADQYSGVIGRDTSSGTARLTVNRNAQSLPSFFKDLGFDSPDQLTEQSLNEVVVPATRRQMAERRQQTLATMVLMGINRVIVKDGEISAKLMFHIDASETNNIKFDENKVTSGNISMGGRSPFGATGVMVNTTSLNAQSAINVRADLTGQVTVRFASETFPLERFADSAAIQLINNNAKVPAPTPAPGAPQPAAPAAAPALPAPVATAPAAAPKAAPVTPAQALAFDPWVPAGA
ncbi:hypothetical protein [Methylibium rhizosphaerae]|uniref:hypothetical protein n=1 Tax=Methylibium rhizosphaerae TaxID=2570323 RepID=UPI00112B4924|nr:hypothetical protein [Methylibium rhizosphaerae]